ncbi:MAG: hypothetical protein MR766_02405 [Erysipelotrichaceae bacterium]|nr:hypothetical protein [Erysipelotrichaceae bacterium]
MNFDNLKPYEFFFSVGYVTLIASVLTLVITQLIKKILTKKGILYEGMVTTKKFTLMIKECSGSVLIGKK